MERQPLLDSVGDPEVADSFKRIVDNHVRAMLSELLKEHQSRCSFQQAEADSMREQLIKSGSEQNPEAFSIPQVGKSSEVLQTTQQQAVANAKKKIGKGPSRSSYTQVDMATKKKEDSAPAKKEDSASAFFRYSSSSVGLGPQHKDHEPVRMSCRQKVRLFVQSGTFDMLSGLAILGNVIVMALQIQYDAFDIGHQLSLDTYTNPAHEVWPGADVAFELLQMIFNILFCIELLLRLFATGFQSFVKPWIWFDTIIIAAGLLDYLSEGSLIGFDATMLRLLRMVRLARLLHLCNAKAAFSTLFLLLKAIHASTTALGWSFMILIGSQIAVALFMCQVLHPLMRDKAADPEASEQLFYYWGTFSSTMMTMCEITLANWVPVCRFMIDEVHETFFLFFVAYRCLFCFSILHVISAVFITETNRVMTNDPELALMKLHRERASFEREFLHLMHGIDNDGDGKIDWPEMKQFLLSPKLSDWLVKVGLAKSDFEKLFWLLEVDGEVEIHKFLMMVGDLKGYAKTVDLLNLFKFMHAMHDDLFRCLNIHAEDEAQMHALEVLEEGGELVVGDEFAEKVSRPSSVVPTD